MLGHKLHSGTFKTKESQTGLERVSCSVPLRYFRPSVIYSVPFERIVHRAYCNESTLFINKQTIINLVNTVQYRCDYFSLG